MDAKFVADDGIGFKVIQKFRFVSSFFFQHSINNVLELGKNSLLSVVA